jgi:phage tail-like protein
MPTGDRKDPYLGHNFRVELDGISRNGFRECSGLDSTSDPVDYREGNEKQFTVRKLSGLFKSGNVTLKGGILDDDALWKWRKTTIDGKTQRKNGSIILMNEAGEEKLRWNFREAWLTKWSGPTFNATGNEVAIETIEIVHEGLTKA